VAKPRERWRARSDAAKSALVKGICRGKALRAWVTSRLDGRVEALVLVFRDLQACLHETGRRKGASEAGRPPPHVVENAAARSLQGEHGEPEGTSGNGTAEVGSEPSSELPLEVEGPKGYLGDGEREKRPPDGRQKPPDSGIERSRGCWCRRSVAEVGEKHLPTT
jgi:hypothetical protein